MILVAIYCIQTKDNWDVVVMTTSKLVAFQLAEDISKLSKDISKKLEVEFITGPHLKLSSKKTRTVAIFDEADEILGKYMLSCQSETKLDGLLAY